MRILAGVLAILLVAGGVLWLARGGISARQEPGRLEAGVMRRLRHVAVPRAARQMANPIAVTPDILKMAMAHFADHCAFCHANDGSGNNEVGRNLYPRAPDMRLAATQSLSDGELFYIIENGVRLTGMPGWSTGTPEGAAASWHLVHFIRHMPSLTPVELLQMEALNPKTRSEWEEEEENDRFLNEPGDSPTGHEGMAMPGHEPKH